MSVLSDIVGSRIRAELFRLLFTDLKTELHVREIERRTGFNDSAIRQELAKLRRLDLVESRRDGNRLYYRAREQHALYRDIRNLTQKTSGLAEVLSEYLAAKEIEVAFVFGSVAQGNPKADSDIDLMVIGLLGMRELTRLLRGASDKLGREINPHVLTPEEYRKRIRRKDHFLSNVLAGSKTMVKGTEDELGRLGT
jgi:predicted nucleotidyltransferase